MNKGHKALLAELKKQSPNQSHAQHSFSYTGSKHKFYSTSVPVQRRIIKEWLKDNEVSTVEVLAVVDSLYYGQSHEEKTMASYLLGYRKDVRTLVKTSDLDKWLGELVGWAEVDALCQNIFGADEVLAKWNEWRSFLVKLSKDLNINKRRASLVLLVSPTWRSTDDRLHQLAYENIERLKREKEILITKAISWLLRSMTHTRKSEVEEYLNKNEESLPKIALRETRRKILTGTKN